MSVIEQPAAPWAVDYPESDGSLIAESDWHRDELFDLIYRLKVRYADSPDTYVTGHMFVYYEQGVPSAVFAPDVMVVFGAPKTPRRVYKLWEEAAPPAVVFEVSSRKTWIEDRGNKRALCEGLGVAEYYLWDPRYEYLTPPLQGYRLVKGVYRALRPAAGGCVDSPALGLRLCCESNRLELYDRITGDRLDRPADVEEAARHLVAEAREQAADARHEAEDARHEADDARQQAEDARQQAEATRRTAEDERLGRIAAEAELERLRAEIVRLRGDRGAGS